MDDFAIKIEGVSKKFVRSIRRSMAYGAIDLVRDFFSIEYDVTHLRKGEFWSLKNIDFEVKKGETFGLVGTNGSGKSTLLRLINGIFPPDQGRITVRGRIGALIAVGAGFHPHMSGRQNIYVNGAILGMNSKEIDEKFNSIVEFADIGEFLDAPVSTYSSGMYVRLGFAIAIHSKPDIMLVDEVLAVGDAQFQRKCLNKIEEMRKEGVTFFLVSHNMQNIQAMCDRAVLMNKGEQLMVGKTADVIAAYELLMQGGELPPILETSLDTTPQITGELELVNRFIGYGTDEIEVKQIRVEDNENNLTGTVRYPTPITIKATINSPKEYPKSLVKVSLLQHTDKKEDPLLLVAGAEVGDILIPEGESTITIKLGAVDIATGKYTLGFHIYDPSHINPYTSAHYGYFQALGSMPNMLAVGKATPGVILHPELELKR